MQTISIVVLFLFVHESKSIIDGFPASSFDIRSQVSVITRFSDGFTNICGGVLIAPTLVLTAAHCVFVNDEFAITAKVTLGDVKLHERDANEQEFWSHAMAIPKKFKNGGTDANDDVAIVFLPRRAQVCDSPLSAQVAKLTSSWSKTFKSSPEVLSSLQIENSVCYIAGWGKTESQNSSFSDTARQIMVKLSFKKVGKNTYLLAKGVLPSSRTCMGDSGSPVYCFVNRVRTLVGNVAHIGSFSRMRSVSPSQHLSFCREFEYTFISDWRESSGRVMEILKKYGDQLDDLEDGQELCFGSGTI